MWVVILNADAQKHVAKLDKPTAKKVLDYLAAVA